MWTDLGRTRPSKLREPHGARDGLLVRAHGPAALPVSQGSRCGLYNQPVLLRLRPGEPLWITEGCSDCWAMLSSGCKAVAILSATTLHDDEVRLLLDLHDRLSTPFHMYPDADVPGERLFLQLRDLLPGLVHHHLPPGCKDFSDYYLSINKITKSS